MSESVTETEKTHHAAAKESREITVAHSPDSDDAFNVLWACDQQSSSAWPALHDHTVRH